ncbi:MAG: SDR family NAD(P)-dependent oxidoreductase [Thermoanaerobaculaceae bacterium]|nr:SDR family NAD(P)-dependent oxidoreductase [Thermoanaerobaculaceae bacterium]
MKNDKYKGKKVLVTGADGFIGSHLAEALVNCGADVRAFCFYNSFGSWGWLDNSEKKGCFEVVMGDIRDRNFVEKSMKGVDIVFHLAALIAIPYSYSAPQSFVETNVMGTLNVLEGALKQNVKRVVHTSTSEVYGTPKIMPITEENPLQGQSPYSASKIGADKLCEAYHCSFGLPVVVLRPFNTYGPRQSMRAVIPTILGQLLSGKKKIELGNLKPKRDLTYISDTVEGFLKVGIAKNVEGEVIQLGTGKTYSVNDIAKLAMKVLNCRADIVSKKERLRPDKSEVMILQSDPSKANKILKWESKVNLEEGLLRTAKWLEQNLNLYKTNIYNL